MIRLILLTAIDADVCYKLVKNLVHQLPECHLDIYFEKAPKIFKLQLHAQKKHIKKNGLIWIPYRLLAEFFKIYDKFNYRVKKVSHSGLLANIDEVKRATLKIVPSFHSKDLWEEVRAKQYDLGIVFGTRIIKKELFCLPKKGMINIHQGLIPWYRGQPPVFWELYNNEGETGITIHEVAELLDAGAVIFQERIRISSMDTLEYLKDQLDKFSIERLPFVIKSVLDGKYTPIHVDLTQGKIYAQPTLKEIFKLKKRGRINSFFRF